MGVRDPHAATDCSHRSTDWTTIGARIREAAITASLIHMAERVREGRPASDAEADTGAGHGLRLRAG
jgi:hypothetical protein